MHRNPSHPPPSRSDRKTILLITIFFVLVSTAFHFIVGNVGARGFNWRHSEPVPSPHILQVTALETPPPTPTPRPTATPRPHQAIHRPPQPSSHHDSPVKRRSFVTPPRRKNDGLNAIPPEASSTAPPGPIVTPVDLPSEMPNAPAPSSPPADDRDMIIAAEFEHRVLPTYPSMAIDAHWEGTVIVLVTIGPDGVIDEHIGTSSGYAVLDRAALKAAKESTYRPPELNGKPAIETYRVIYTFSLNDA